MKIPFVFGVIPLSLLALGGGAHAQDSMPGLSEAASPWYVGLGISKTEASIPQVTLDQVTATLAPALGAGTTIIDQEERSTGGKIFLGYGFGRYFAVEAGYVTLGSHSASFDFRSGLSSVGTFNLDYKMTGVFADAVGIMPLGPKWALLGRVGVNAGRTSAKLDGDPLTIITSGDNREKTKVREKFGLGAQYAFTPSLTLRAEWERYKMPDPFSDDLIDVDSATAALLYHF